VCFGVCVGCKVFNYLYNVFMADSLIKPKIDMQGFLAYKKMRTFATILFIIMVVIFIIAKIYERENQFIPFIRAFAEAAMVGALADWFAVTALFRHPLGLPIPHTAIIPKSKDRIGTGLGNFISRNFLQPNQVARRLENVDLGKSIANYLADTNRTQKIALAISNALPKLFGLLKDGPIMEWLSSNIKSRLQHADFALFLADTITLFTSKKRHIPLVDLIIFHTDMAVNKYEPDFRDKVTKNTKWLPKLFSVDETASDSLMAAIKDTLKEAANDPNHKLRNSIDEAIAHFEYNLRYDEKLRQQIKDWQSEFLSSAQLNDYIKNIWIAIKETLNENSDERQKNLSFAISGALNNIAHSLLENEELRHSIDEKLKEWAVELAAAQGDSVGKMVADTIKSWDSTTVVTQIENAVGRDLQYIRINGTLIGGLIGLIIHSLSILIFHR
jgi:uncharacterized membrane-anchored protein YjiN (DUF445 family)